MMHLSRTDVEAMLGGELVNEVALGHVDDCEACALLFESMLRDAESNRRDIELDQLAILRGEDGLGPVSIRELPEEGPGRATSGRLTALQESMLAQLARPVPLFVLEREWPEPVEIFRERLAGLRARLRGEHRALIAEAERRLELPTVQNASFPDALELAEAEPAPRENRARRDPLFVARFGAQRLGIYRLHVCGADDGLWNEITSRLGARRPRASAVDITEVAEDLRLLTRPLSIAASEQPLDVVVDEEVSPFDGAGADGRLPFRVKPQGGGIRVEVSAPDSDLAGALVRVSVNGVAIGFAQSLESEHDETSVGTAFELERADLARLTQEISRRARAEERRGDGVPRWLLRVELASPNGASS
jgi:hypothetical protein